MDGRRVDDTAAVASAGYTLTGGDGRPYRSAVPGRFGGYRRGRIYGRLDCPSALRHIARRSYVRHRVFFADEATAVAAGYRPCAVCLPQRHRVWRKAEPS
ncbi:Ada metal-binding domain-containing protein [Streptomyces adustus]|uniref:Ada metal-binding domain-containing protein n=1 Tax=Streptomyces adustus TaxID=1609272 RepID=UPI003084229F